jgi:hypothetical protein
MTTSEKDKLLTGVLFKNDKDGNDKRPDYKGKIVLENGSIRWVSCWVKRNPDNSVKLLSLALQVPDGQQPMAAEESEFNI